MAESAASLLSSPAALVVAAVFGAVWGSFFNVCIARVPLGRSIVRPGSCCGACGVPVRALDNVPILSFLWLRGRCRACGVPFSPRYPLVEATGALLAAALWWQLVASDAGSDVGVRVARFAYYFAFSGVLVVLSFIDLATMLLPDVITRPAIAVFFLAGFGVHDATWTDRLIGAAAGYAFVWLVAEVYYRATGREGLGLGDGKLLALVGAAFGWQALPLVVFAGSMLGALISLPIVLRSRRRASGESLREVQVPFGPFLALGAFVYLFAGRAVVALATGASL